MPTSPATSTTASARCSARTSSVRTPATLDGEDSYRFRNIRWCDPRWYDAMPKELRADLHERVRRLARPDEARSGRGARRVRGLPPRAGGSATGEELGPVDDAARAMAARAAEHLLAAGDRAWDAATSRGQTVLGPGDCVAAGRRPSCDLGDAVPRTGALHRRSDRRRPRYLDGRHGPSDERGRGCDRRSPRHRACADPDAPRSGVLDAVASLTETELLMTPLEAAGDELGLAEGLVERGRVPILARRRCGIPGGAGTRPGTTRNAPDPSGSSGTSPTSCSGRSSGDPSRAHEVERRAGELIAEMGTTGNDSFELNGSLAFALAVQGRDRTSRMNVSSDSWTRARELGERLHLAAAHPHLEATIAARSLRRDGASVASQGIAAAPRDGRDRIPRDVVDLSRRPRSCPSAKTGQGRDGAAASRSACGRRLTSMTQIGSQTCPSGDRARSRAGSPRRSRTPERRPQFGEPTDYLLGEMFSSHRAHWPRSCWRRGAQEEGLTHLRAALEYFFERKGILVLLGPLRDRIDEVAEA